MTEAKHKRRWVTFNTHKAETSIGVKSASAKLTERAQAVAAVDAMIAARPLVPPPMPRAENRQRAAGACVLANEIREGLYQP